MFISNQIRKDSVFGMKLYTEYDGSNNSRKIQKKFEGDLYVKLFSFQRRKFGVHNYR